MISLFFFLLRCTTPKQHPPNLSITVYLVS
nr:MAG TPA: hypothetical protein [Caudoviricetes sp.]